MKIAICDDEDVFLKRLTQIVSEYMEKLNKEYEIEQFSSGETFAALGEQMAQYRIVFLDMEMGEMNGMQTAHMFRRYSEDGLLVFVTAYAEYSLQGYSVDTLRYIIKTDPLFRESVEESLNAACKKLRYATETCVFGFKEGTKQINLCKLIYVESKLHNLLFHIADADGESVYMMRGSLSACAEKIKGKGFLIVHQSYLVNSRFIRRFKYNQVILKTGGVLPVSKNRYKEAHQAFLAYEGDM